MVFSDLFLIACQKLRNLTLQKRFGRPGYNCDNGIHTTMTNVILASIAINREEPITYNEITNVLHSHTFPWTPIVALIFYFFIFLSPPSNASLMQKKGILSLHHF